MHLVEQLAHIPFFAGMASSRLRQLAECAKARTFEPNELIVRQHDEAQTVLFLIEGVAQVLISGSPEQTHLVGTIREPGALIGWSAFRPPYRYTASIRSEGVCQTLAIPRQVFEEFFAEDPVAAKDCLERVAEAASDRLVHARELLLAVPERTDFRGE